MTKSYRKMNVPDAMYTAARRYPGSIEALANIMGKSDKVLRNKLNPASEFHVLTLDETLRIIELLDVTVPSAADMAMNAIGCRLNRVIRRRQGVDGDCRPIQTMALEVSALTGLLCSDAACINGDATEKDIDNLKRDIALLLTALHNMADAADNAKVTGA